VTRGRSAFLPTVSDVDGCRERRPAVERELVDLFAERLGVGADNGTCDRDVVDVERLDEKINAQCCRQSWED